MGKHVTMWTVYDHPSDFPDHFVARPMTLAPGVVTVGEQVLYDTLAEAREALQGMGLHQLARHPDDDPVIVEVWL